MNLKFKILWLDDQPDSQRGIAENLRMRLAWKGFDLQVKFVPEIKGDPDARIRELIKENDWDLVLVDWDQGKDKPDGAKLAKRVRIEARYTEIIFYSSEPPATLRKLVFDEGVDGVYCSQRGEFLKTAAWGVIETMIRKVLDLTHMRGLVMAAVADLDRDVDDCLRKLHSKMVPERRLRLVQDIIGRIQQVAQDNVLQMQKLVGAEFDQVLQHRGFSTNLKGAILLAAMKEFSEELAAELVIERFSRYEAQVVHPRNRMAHQRVVSDGKSLKLGEKGEVITEEAMADIRRQLHEHRENLSDLGALLDAWQGSGVVEKVKAATTGQGMGS